MSKHYNKKKGTRSPETNKTGDNKRRYSDAIKVGEGNGVDITAPQKFNDLNWYVHSPEEAKQLGSLAYPNATGVTTELMDKAFRVPGIAALDVCPLYGYSESPDSAINMAARYVYAQNRKVNAGSTNYTATHYGFYLFAFDSIYTILSHVKRALSTMYNYSTFNRYTPNALLKAMGFSMNDLTNNIPGKIARLNNFIRRVSVFNIPDVFDIFKRHSFMFSMVMMDSDSPKSQYYLYRPDTYYTYELTDSISDGSALIAHTIDYTSISKFDEWMEILEEMLGKVIADETFQIMNGDTEKAFGDRVYKLSLYNETDPLTVTLDQKVREQMMNATVVGRVQDNDVIETPGASGSHEDFYFVTRPKAALYARTKSDGTMLLNSYSKPDPEVNIEITRLMYPYEAPLTTSDNGIGLDLRHVGSEVVTKVHLITIDTTTGFDPNGDVVFFSNKGYTHVKTFDITYSDVPGAMNELQQLFNFISDYMQFDYAPRCVLRLAYIPQETSEPEYKTYGLLSRTEHWTTISKNQLHAMNDIAMQKLFGF